MAAKKKRVRVNRFVRKTVWVPRDGGLKTAWDKSMTFVTGMVLGMILGFVIIWGTSGIDKPEKETIKCPACRGKGEWHLPVYYLEERKVQVHDGKPD